MSTAWTISDKKKKALINPLASSMLRYQMGVGSVGLFSVSSEYFKKHDSKAEPTSFLRDAFPKDPYSAQEIQEQNVRKICDIFFFD